MIDIKPNEDSKLKVVMHEAFGINALISLQDEHGSSDMSDYQFGDISEQVGSTEILYTQVKKGKTYTVEI
jgi:translation elongation factor EF-1beta